MAADRRTYSGTRGAILLPSEVVVPRRTGTGGRLTGAIGAIKWHYFTAADVKDYTARRDATGAWTLTCRIVNADAYKMTMKPLRFVAPYQGGDWRWPIESIEIRDGQATATLGPLLP